jgi:non-specific serine/threonine protein kinase
VVDPPKSIGDELSPGTKLCGGQYTIERYLNSGGFGITYLARDSLGRKVVIKECFPGAMCYRVNHTVRLRSQSGEQEFAKIIDLFEKEARALSELQHPYIVGVHQIFHDNDTSYMALDYVEGRDLLQIIEEEPDRLGPEETRKLLVKLLEAVTYIHDRDILHRDISPDNIILEDDNTPVLIDFGAARESATRVSRVLSKVLTVKDGYSPQEFYLAGSKQGYSSDLYALAATFFHAVSGSPPPSSQLRLAAAAKNLKDPLEPLSTTNTGYERFFLDAMNRCLSIFPAERLSSAQEWLDVIDVERRRRVLLEKAAKDRDLEKRIARIVRQSRIELGEMAKSGRTEAPSPKAPAPASTKAQVATASRPLAKPDADKDVSVSEWSLLDFEDDLHDDEWEAPPILGEEPHIEISPEVDRGLAQAASVKPLARLLSGTVHLFQSLQSLGPSSVKEVRK